MGWNLSRCGAWGSADRSIRLGREGLPTECLLSSSVNSVCGKTRSGQGGEPGWVD